MLFSHVQGFEIILVKKRLGARQVCGPAKEVSERSHPPEVPAQRHQEAHERGKIGRGRGWLSGFYVMPDTGYLSGKIVVDLIIIYIDIQIYNTNNHTHKKIKVSK